MSEFRSDSTALDRMLEILIETIGKDVTIFGVLSDRPIVASINSVDIDTITATIKRTGEEVVIATSFVVLALRTSARRRTSVFSRTRGCDFILRLNAPPALLVS